MTKQVFSYGKYTYDYYLIKEARQTISLTVKPDLSVVLKSPIGYSKEKINAFLKRKWLWLEKQLSFFKKFQNNNGKKEYISGESFLYLGRQYKLIVCQAKNNQVKLDQGKLMLFTNGGARNGKNNKKILEKWYEEKTKDVLCARYQEVLKSFKVKTVPDFVIKKMDKRWGSFVSNKKILLNPKLIQAPKYCIDYVITHELCHLERKRHDSNFFKLLESKIPNWEKVKEKLEMKLLTEGRM